MNDTPKPTRERAKHLREAAYIVRGLIACRPSLTQEDIAVFFSDLADANDAIAALEKDYCK